MVDKYYTPTIEEFHEGFEYEYSYCGGEWVKEKFTTSSGDIDCMAGDWYEFSPNCPKTACRVKYLDSADIEECGWETEDNEFWCNCFVLSGQLEYQNVTIECFYDDITMDNYSSWREVVFHGKIKNKSELKKIMKMINIF